MFVMANLLETTAIIISKVLTIYWWVLLIAVLLSWVNPDPYNPIVRFLRMTTEPVFDWVRRTMPFTMVGMLDLSPLVVFFLIWFCQLFVVRTLLDLSLRLR